jgi:hypothetical protein
MDLQNGTYPASIIENWLRDQAKLSPNSRAWRKALGGGGSVVVGEDTYLFKSSADGRYEVFRANAAEVQEIYRILDRASKGRTLMPFKVIGLILIVSGAIGLAMYKPLPDNSAFAYALPYQGIFAATLVVGVVILLLAIRKARATR